MRWKSLTKVSTRDWDEKPHATCHMPHATTHRADMPKAGAQLWIPQADYAQEATQRQTDGRTGGGIGRQTERAWLKGRQDVGNGRNGTDVALTKQRHKTHTQRRTAVARTKREREMDGWRGKGRGKGSGRKTKIVPGLGLLTDAAPSVIVFRALFHCLVATVIVFYCMGVRRGESKAKRGDGGEATVRVMRCWRVC